MGNMYFDLTGNIKAVNHTTNDWVEIKLTPKSWSSQSQIEGYGFDKHGNKLYEIKGSWLEKITLKNLRKCTSEVMWEQNEPLENYVQQYGFT